MRLTAINELPHFYRKNFTFGSNGTAGRNSRSEAMALFNPSNHLRAASPADSSRNQVRISRASCLAVAVSLTRKAML